MFQQMRRRLALWYTGVTAVLLLVFALAGYGYVQTTLSERIDDTLDHVVEVVVATLPSAPPQWPEDVEEDRVALEWFAPTGERIWSTLDMTLVPPLHPGVWRETVTISGDEALRQVTQPVYLDHTLLGYLRVSHPWFEVTKPVRQLLIDLTVGGLVSLGLVAVAGWFLSGLAMTPVRQSYQRLEQFTADASHELRSPLASLQMNWELLHSQYQSQPQIQAMGGLIQRLGRLVDDLLFLARQDTQGVGAGEACPLDGLVMEVTQEQQGLAPGVMIHLELPTTENPDTLTVWGNYGQLGRLFTNVIRNAWQYTPAGGQVWVRLSVQGDTLAVAVQDTGVGIAEADLPRLFDRFYRVDPARGWAGGSGLGLAIAQSIVQAHQGTMDLTSKLGQGTLVVITLPRFKELIHRG
ncbi:histidine kinase [Gloeomargarita lithophora Alchichica-D10]|uniref:histidine kinase n=1 Tax=Gloeomargarita lithophora Alchichica-D10 TaxID=1188229 RepID=A0A1J0AAC9_9CYAN|nr:HAMP domain-containing sensor histidine kinase [Gloeomargarita lithophora]APB32892.1 histidine kinase [Gloeomargarita lithophora Alchichica-D10]